MRISDWSSDVCSSDLLGFLTVPGVMDWQYGAAPLGFQPVESVDQASHVRGAVLVCTSERARDRVHHDQAWIDSARVEEELVCDALDCLNDLCRGESVMERRQAIRQKNWRAFQ